MGQLILAEVSEGVGLIPKNDKQQGMVCNWHITSSIDSVCTRLLTYKAYTIHRNCYGGFWGSTLTAHAIRHRVPMVS